MIRLCGYFVLYFALCACLLFDAARGRRGLTLARAGTRLIRLCRLRDVPDGEEHEGWRTFATAADKRRVQIVLLAVSVCVGAGMALLGGGLLALAALAVLWRYRAVAAKQFGGITGDLAGWFLQRAELVMDTGGTADFGRGGSGDFHHRAAVQRQADVRAGNSAGGRFFDVQNLAAQADDLDRLADELAADYDVAAATEIGGGIVPMDAGERRARGRQPGGWPACWRRARHGDRDVCGIPTALKGELPC